MFAGRSRPTVMSKPYRRRGVRTRRAASEVLHDTGASAVETAVTLHDAERSDERNRSEAVGGELSAERLFSASVSKTKLLKRDEETQLAEEIVRARARVRRIIRRARKLTRAALADAGRGVVTPDADFRE